MRVKNNDVFIQFIIIYANLYAIVFIATRRNEICAKSIKKNWGTAGFRVDGKYHKI